MISPVVDFFYKCTDYYSPQHERSVRWDDPTLNISWPVANPVVSEKDQAAPTLDTAERFESCRMSQLLQQVDHQLTQSARTGGPGSTSKQPADSLT